MSEVGDGIDFRKMRRLYLTGPAGGGKTSAGIARINHLIAAGVAPDTILLLTPQRSYALPYIDSLDQPAKYQLGKATIGGLARRYVSLFWPYAAQYEAFDRHRQPEFLSYEVAQYFMSVVTRPHIEQGRFADLKLTLPRLYTQLIDNLNKASATGISIEDVADRLSTSLARSAGESDEHRIADDIRVCIAEFRSYCIQHNLLDFSIYLRLFDLLMQDCEAARRHLFERYRHVVADNLEEDIPVTHDLLRRWVPHAASAWLIIDEHAGFRRFLGADPGSAESLREVCDEELRLAEVYTAPASLQVLGDQYARVLRNLPVPEVDVEGDSEALPITVRSSRLYQQMIDSVVHDVADLVEDGATPEDISVISPFLSDSLRFALSTRFDRLGIPYVAHRPSRSLHDEPVTKVLMTLAGLAHPNWLPHLSTEAVAHTLFHVIDGMDLVRAALLTRSIFQPNTREHALLRFESAAGDVRERVTYRLGSAYELLRDWMEAYRADEVLPVDHFFSRLFGEVLSQPEFGFHEDVPAGAAVARVVESARNFRQAVSTVLGDDHALIGRAYVDMVRQGVISAYYRQHWAAATTGVLLAPAHTFLLRNRPARFQCWLDIGNPAWYTRINQPLTNPYVLSRGWQVQATWDYEKEMAFERDRLEHQVKGLVRRCTDGLYLYASELSPYGQEQRGLLLTTLNRMARRGRLLGNSRAS